MAKMSVNKFQKIYDTAMEKMLDPAQPTGAWFEGDVNQFEEWAGDALMEFTEYFLAELGIFLK